MVRLLDGQITLLAANDKMFLERRHGELHAYGTHVVLGPSLERAKVAAALPDLTAAIVADDLGSGIEQLCCQLDARGVPFLLLGDRVPAHLRRLYQMEILPIESPVDDIVGGIQHALVHDHLRDDGVSPVVLDLVRSIRRSEERVRRQVEIVRRLKFLRIDHSVAEALLNEMNRSLIGRREHLSTIIRQQTQHEGR